MVIFYCQKFIGINIFFLKVTAVNLHEIVHVDEQLSIQAFYAGHVLGAAMFLVKVGSESVFFNFLNFFKFLNFFLI